MSRSIPLSLALVFALTAFATLVSAQTEAVAIIAHPDCEVDSVARVELSKIFLKRVRTWKNGEAAVPVDQLPESSIRTQFSKKIHERGVVNIEVYWKRMIFSGRGVPPKELTSDAEIVDFVRKTPGAVGYVSALADREGVKLLSVQEDK